MTSNLVRIGKLAAALNKLSPVKLTSGLKKEAEVSKQLHADALATLKRMKERDPGLAKALDQAYGYAVLPAVGKATLVLGGTYGKGEVFRQGELVGYCGLGQFTLGVQVGGQTFSELVLIQNKETFDRFKHAGMGFAANASAVIVKAGAAATNNYKGGLQVYVNPEGGLMLELGIGLQKLVFRPAALTRGKRADEELELPAWLGEVQGAAEEEAQEAEGGEAEARAVEEEGVEETGGMGERKPREIPLAEWRRALPNAGHAPARKAAPRKAAPRKAAPRKAAPRARPKPRAAAPRVSRRGRTAAGKRRTAGVRRPRTSTAAARRPRGAAQPG
jgi:lipid-binding SYLF domain-containing protein